MNIKIFKTYELMIFIALAAIAFSFNNMYLSVEFTLVLILALSPVFLAAARHMKNASAPENREIGKPNQNRMVYRIVFFVCLYFCFLMSILSACLVADIAWSIALEQFPIDNFFSRRYLGWIGFDRQNHQKHNDSDKFDDFVVHDPTFQQCLARGSAYRSYWGTPRNEKNRARGIREMKADPLARPGPWRRIHAMWSPGIWPSSKAACTRCFTALQIRSNTPNRYYDSIFGQSD